MHTQTDQIRRDQSQEGIRRTLTVKPGTSAPSTARKPFVAKGHDAILKNMQDTGGQILITTMGDGIEHRGKMVARDKFTITIQLTTGERITFYKHAIESFSSVASASVQ